MQPISPDNYTNKIIDILYNWYKVLRGNISFGNPNIQNTVVDNIKGQWISGASPGVANTEFAITHVLGSVPSGYIVMQKNPSGDFYNGVTAWTNTQIFLKCSVPSVGYLIFIVGV